MHPTGQALRPLALADAASLDFAKKAPRAGSASGAGVWRCSLCGDPRQLARPAALCAADGFTACARCALSHWAPAAPALLEPLGACVAAARRMMATPEGARALDPVALRGLARVVPTDPAAPFSPFLAYALLAFAAAFAELEPGAASPLPSALGSSAQLKQAAQAAAKHATAVHATYQTGLREYHAYAAVSAETSPSTFCSVLLIFFLPRIHGVLHC